MKQLGYCAAVLGLLALSLWTATLAIDLVEKVHSLPDLLHTHALSGGIMVTGTMTTTGMSQSNNAAKPAFFTADETTDTVPAPSDHPPLRITCGAHTFHVVYASHDWLLRKRDPAYAQTDMDTELIILDRQRNAIEVREDVLHELMHIALWESGGKQGGMRDTEEGYIKPSAPVLRDILVDNPRLLKWLVKAGG